MRRGGQKRSRDELLADPGHTVRITVNRQTDGIGATAHPADWPMAIPWRLSDVRILSLSGDSLVLAGLEPLGACWEHRYERQAWWLRFEPNANQATAPGHQPALTAPASKPDEVS